MTTVQTLNLSPVDGPSVWNPADFISDTSWCYVLNEEQRNVLISTSKKWDGLDFRSLKIDDVKELLSPLQPIVSAITSDLGHRGFALLRGVPVEHMSDATIASVYWAIGMLFGNGLSQNAKADFICPVTDMGVDFGYTGAVSQRNVRGYQSRADLNYHCDPTDVVALLCLRQARSGGASSIVSTPAIFNYMLEHHPEHLETLMEGFAYDRKGEEWPGEEAVTPRIPVFVHHGDRISCRYGRSYIIGGGQKQGVDLSPGNHAALDCFDAIARREDFALKMMFQPGDIQFLNNFTVIHGRTAYEDDPDPAKRRFLYRLWLHMGQQMPWAAECEVMRWAHSRWGNLGRSLTEWEEIQKNG